MALIPAPDWPCGAVVQMQKTVEAAQRVVLQGRQLAALGVSQDNIAVIHGESHDLPMTGPLEEEPVDDKEEQEAEAGGSPMSPRLARKTGFLGRNIFKKAEDSTQRIDPPLEAVIPEAVVLQVSEEPPSMVEIMSLIDAEMKEFGRAVSREDDNVDEDLEDADAPMFRQGTDVCVYSAPVPAPPAVPAVTCDSPNACPEPGTPDPPPPEGQDATLEAAVVQAPANSKCASRRRTGDKAGHRVQPPWKMLTKDEAITCPGLAYGSIDWYHWIAQRLTKEGPVAMWKYGCTNAKWEGFTRYIADNPQEWEGPWTRDVDGSWRPHWAGLTEEYQRLWDEPFQEKKSVYSRSPGGGWKYWYTGALGSTLQPDEAEALMRSKRRRSDMFQGGDTPDVPTNQHRRSEGDKVKEGSVDLDILSTMRRSESEPGEGLEPLTTYQSLPAQLHKKKFAFGRHISIFGGPPKGRDLFGIPSRAPPQCGRGGMPTEIPPGESDSTTTTKSRMGRKRHINAKARRASDNSSPTGSNNADTRPGSATAPSRPISSQGSLNTRAEGPNSFEAGGPDRPPLRSEKVVRQESAAQVRPAAGKIFKRGGRRLEEQREAAMSSSAGSSMTSTPACVTPCGDAESLPGAQTDLVNASDVAGAGEGGMAPDEEATPQEAPTIDFAAEAGPAESLEALTSTESSSLSHASNRAPLGRSATPSRRTSSPQTGNTRPFSASPRCRERSRGLASTPDGNRVTGDASFTSRPRLQSEGATLTAQNDDQVTRSRQNGLVNGAQSQRGAATSARKKQDMAANAAVPGPIGSTESSAPGGQDGHVLHSGEAQPEVCEPNLATWATAAAARRRNGGPQSLGVPPPPAALAQACMSESEEEEGEGEEDGTCQLPPRKGSSIPTKASNRSVCVPPIRGIRVALPGPFEPGSSQALPSYLGDTGDDAQQRGPPQEPSSARKTSQRTQTHVKGGTRRGIVPPLAIHREVSETGTEDAFAVPHTSCDRPLPECPPILPSPPAVRNKERHRIHAQVGVTPRRGARPDVGLSLDSNPPPMTDCPPFPPWPPSSRSKPTPRPHTQANVPPGPGSSPGLRTCRDSSSDLLLTVDAPQLMQSPPAAIIQTSHRTKPERRGSVGPGTACFGDMFPYAPDPVLAMDFPPLIFTATAMCKLDLQQASPLDNSTRIQSARSPRRGLTPRPQRPRGVPAFPPELWNALLERAGDMASLGHHVPSVRKAGCGNPPPALCLTGSTLRSSHVSSEAFQGHLGGRNVAGLPGGSQLGSFADEDTRIHSTTNLDSYPGMSHIGQVRFPSGAHPVDGTGDRTGWQQVPNAEKHGWQGVGASIMPRSERSHVSPPRCAGLGRTQLRPLIMHSQEDLGPEGFLHGRLWGGPAGGECSPFLGDAVFGNALKTVR
eukprot:jgi/Botrbrau1/20929/Bobra.0135s0059.2